MIQAISAILSATVMALLIKDYLKDKPNLVFESSRYVEKELRIPYPISVKSYLLTIRNVGRREAPDATAEVSIQEFRKADSLTPSESLRWITPSMDFNDTLSRERAFTLKRDGWAMLELPVAMMKGQRGVVALKLIGGIKAKLEHFTYSRLERKSPWERDVELTCWPGYMIAWIQAFWFLWDGLMVVLRLGRRIYGNVSSRIRKSRRKISAVA